MTVETSPESESESEPRREPYQAPKIVWEEDLGVGANLAYACDKVSGQSPDCTIFPTS